jgi:hypothetical protein
MANFWVSGIVSQRDKEPYVQLANENGLIAQLTMAQGRIIAMDILTQCSRAEMDAMVLKFMDKLGAGPDAGVAMMGEFREFRSVYDNEVLQHTQDDKPPYETEA